MRKYLMVFLSQKGYGYCHSHTFRKVLLVRLNLLSKVQNFFQYM